MKKRKYLLPVVLIVIIGILGASFYVYKEYNRKNTNLADVKAKYALSADDMISDFITNEKAGNEKYLAKVVEVSGRIKKVDTDPKGFSTIVLGDTASMSSVRCSLDSTIHAEALQLAAGQTITIKGVCTGYNADDLGIGSDVILNRCIQVKK